MAMTTAVEARVCSARRARIVAAARADADIFPLARAALEVARAQHCIECFVSAYRGFPELVHVLLASDATREETLAVVSIADDLSLFPDRHTSSTGTWEGLSRREQEVLVLVAEGHSNRAVGQKLFIAEATVKVHIGHILEKLGVPSRTAAALRVPHHARSTRRSARPNEATGGSMIWKSSRWPIR